MNTQPEHSGRERKNTNNIRTFDLTVPTNTLNNAAQDVWSDLKNMSCTLKL